MWVTLGVGTGLPPSPGRGSKFSVQKTWRMTALKTFRIFKPYNCRLVCRALSALKTIRKPIEKKSSRTNGLNLVLSGCFTKSHRTGLSATLAHGPLHTLPNALQPMTLHCMLPPMWPLPCNSCPDANTNATGNAPTHRCANWQAIHVLDCTLLS